MTVSSSASSAQFPGNGTTTVFPLPFRFFDNGDVTAYLIDDDTLEITPLSIGVNYTLIGAGEPEVDGNPVSQLTMLVAPPNGQTLVVNREMEAVQETDIINQARFYPEIHENVFDRLTMLIQQAINRVSTSLSLDISRRYFDARGLQIKNLADPTDAQDATTKNYVDVQNNAQDVRIDALSAGLPGTNYAFPWSTTTTQSTQVLTPGFTFTSATLYLNGIAQTYGKAFIVSYNQIVLAEAIPAGTEVYAILGQNIVPTVPSEVIRPENYGADISGIADSSSAFQQAVDVAGALAASTGRVVDVELTGTLLLSPQFYDAAVDWRRCILIPDRVRIISRNGAKIRTAIAFANRSVVLLARGDYITIEGVEHEDVSVASSFAVFIGAGSTYDSGLASGRTYKELSVIRCRSQSAWMTASVQFGTLDDGTISWDGFRVYESTSIARLNSTTSGNFNARSDPPGKVLNVDMVDSYAKNGATASSFNIVGVKNFSVINCDSELNLYGACEIENGSANGTVVNLKSKNDVIGLWIDDSVDIDIFGVRMENTIPTLVSPLLGTFTLNRNVLRITKQGYPDDINAETGRIRAWGIKGTNASINITSFGTPPVGGAPVFSSISIDGFLINNDGVSLTGRGVFFSNVPDMTLRNGVIIGAATEQITGSSSGGHVTIDTVRCYPKGAETPAGLNVIGTSSSEIKNSNFQTFVAIPTGDRTEINTSDAAAIRQNRLRGDTALSQMIASGPVRPGQYTLTTLPSAAAFTGYEIDVTNATGGPKRCRSNGSVWQILNTTTTVS